MLKVKTPDFSKTTALLERRNRIAFNKMLEGYGERGVSALSAATPRDTGETANSWGYHIEEVDGKYRLIWTNTNLAGSTPVVILIQYGHSTKSNTYVPGIDFINPALRPLVAEINKKLRVEVK